jgi:hypothetical protein
MHAQAGAAGRKLHAAGCVRTFARWAKRRCRVRRAVPLVTRQCTHTIHNSAGGAAPASQVSPACCRRGSCPSARARDMHTLTPGAPGARAASAAIFSACSVHLPSHMGATDNPISAADHSTSSTAYHSRLGATASAGWSSLNWACLPHSDCPECSYTIHFCILVPAAASPAPIRSTYVAAAPPSLLQLPSWCRCLKQPQARGPRFTKLGRLWHVPKG